MPRYSAQLMDHFNAPRNAGEMSSPDVVGNADIHGKSPRMSIYLRIVDDKVEQAAFTTFGCGASIASGSALTELVRGKHLAQCFQIEVKDVVDALDGVPPDKQFCADLAVRALRDALRQVGLTEC